MKRSNINILNQVVSEDFEELSKNHATSVFSSLTLDYLNQLSKILFKDSRTREHPDVGTFAFYCRQGNLLALKKNFDNKAHIRLGRGLIFHIAPSNVPVNFAYSLIAGLLSGNTNIIKIPSKNFEQIQIIIDAIDQISTEKQHKETSKRIVLIKYNNSDLSITERLSSLCNVRVIWGGDETIRNIRKHPLNPRAFDLTFSDRYSICVINANSFVDEINPDSIAAGFYNDTYLFDQNACTSPHLIIWLGSDKNVESSQNIFWSSVHSFIKDKYSIQSVQAVDKLTAFYDQTLGMKDIKLQKSEDNLLWRIELSNLEEDVEHFRCNSGYFSEYHASSLEELVPIINPKYQTLSYYGLDHNQLEDFIFLGTPRGIDRIVPIGKTTDFSLIWDGYDLISDLSRTIEII